VSGVVRVSGLPGARTGSTLVRRPRRPAGAPGRAGTTTASQGTAALRTYAPKAEQIERAWHVVDADGLVLGRLATEVARILRGKHRPYFAPHMDTGDHVVVVNAAKVVLTADKARDKFAYRHSGYPGGLSRRSYADLMARSPEEVVRRAVRGMLPKNTLGRQQLAKLKVYPGPDHPHAAQDPQPLDLAAARRAS
jgi:large subunit ribosomal protein L13